MPGRASPSEVGFRALSTLTFRCARSSAAAPALPVEKDKPISKQQGSLYTPRRGNKTCKFLAEGLDFWEVILVTFRTMLGVARPLKVGGLRPPTFPGTSPLGLWTIFYIFDLKKFEDISVSGARFLIPKFLIRPAGCDRGPLKKVIRGMR